MNRHYQFFIKSMAIVLHFHQLVIPLHEVKKIYMV